jgi:hypothetical protein
MELREHQRALLAALPVWDHDGKRLSRQLALRLAIESRALKRTIAAQRAKRGQATSITTFPVFCPVSTSRCASGIRFIGNVASTRRPDSCIAGMEARCRGARS